MQRHRSIRCYTVRQNLFLQTCHGTNEPRNDQRFQADFIQVLTTFKIKFATLNNMKIHGKMRRFLVYKFDHDNQQHQ
jgi:hypothetical protein